jgi:hypothetical protein
MWPDCCGLQVADERNIVSQTLLIVTKDAFGNLRDQGTALPLQLQFFSDVTSSFPGKSFQVPGNRIVDENNGNYSTTFTINNPGDYSMKVLAGGQELKGSPQAVTASVHLSQYGAAGAEGSLVALDCSTPLPSIIKCPEANPPPPPAPPPLTISPSASSGEMPLVGRLNVPMRICVKPQSASGLLIESSDYLINLVIQELGTGADFGVELTYALAQTTAPHPYDGWGVDCQGPGRYRGSWTPLVRGRFSIIVQLGTTEGTIGFVNGVPTNGVSVQVSILLPNVRTYFFSNWSTPPGGHLQKEYCIPNGTRTPALRSLGHHLYLY